MIFFLLYIKMSDSAYLTYYQRNRVFEEIDKGIEY